jgi:hypothetical protein
MPYANKDKQKEYMKDYARKQRELFKKLKECSSLSENHRTGEQK